MLCRIFIRITCNLKKSGICSCVVCMHLCKCSVEAFSALPYFLLPFTLKGTKRFLRRTKLSHADKQDSHISGKILTAIRAGLRSRNLFTVIGCKSSKMASVGVLTAQPAGRENDCSMQPSKLQKTSGKDSFRVKKLNEYAVLPKRGSSGAAGYDLAR